MPPPAADLILIPALSRFLKQFPEIRVEVSVDAALTNIVPERFDAGIRAGRRIERDMIAVRISKDLSWAVAASHDYLKAHGTPETPQDLRHHNCIRFRFPSGEIVPWRFARAGGSYEVAVEGSAIINDESLALKLVLDGVGILYHARDVSWSSDQKEEVDSVVREFNSGGAGTLTVLSQPPAESGRAPGADRFLMKAEYKSQD